MLISPNVSVGINKRRAIPDTPLPPVLQNRDVVVYGKRLAETYAVGDPMPTIGEPAFTAINAAAEATFRQTPGGFGYLESTLDGYELPFVENPSDFTAIVIGRDWAGDFWSMFGRTSVNASSSNSWDILHFDSNILVRTRSGGVASEQSVTQPVGTFWMAALRVSGGMRLARFNNTILSNAAYGAVDVSNGPLQIMSRFDGSYNRKFGSGDIALAVYHNGAISDAELDAIYALRPTS